MTGVPSTHEVLGSIPSTHTSLVIILILWLNLSNIGVKEPTCGHRLCESAEDSFKPYRLTPQAPNSLDLSGLFTKDTGWSFHVSSPTNSHARKPKFTGIALGFIPRSPWHSS